MTVEELKALLQDESSKEDTKVLIEAAGFGSIDSIRRLEENNRALVLEKRQAVKEAAEAKKKLDDIDLDAYNTYKAAASSKPADSTPQNSREFQKLQKELETERQERKGLESEYNQRIIKDELRTVFDSLGIDPIHAPLLIDANAYKAKIETEGNQRHVYINDIPLQDYFKGFVQTESGKAYLRKPINSGAGAQSIQSANGKGTIQRDDFFKLKPAEQTAAIKAGIKIIE